MISRINVIFKGLLTKISQSQVTKIFFLKTQDLEGKKRLVFENYYLRNVRVLDTLFVIKLTSDLKSRTLFAALNC